MAFGMDFLNPNIRIIIYNPGLVDVLLTLESIYDKSFNPNMQSAIKHIWTVTDTSSCLHTSHCASVDLFLFLMLMFRLSAEPSYS